jgi:hypothetical protein
VWLRGVEGRERKQNQGAGSLYRAVRSSFRTVDSRIGARIVACKKPRRSECPGMMLKAPVAPVSLGRSGRLGLVTQVDRSIAPTANIPFACARRGFTGLSLKPTVSIGRNSFKLNVTPAQLVPRAEQGALVKVIMFGIEIGFFEFGRFLGRMPSQP